MNFSFAKKLLPLVVALLTLASTPARAELEGVGAIIAASSPMVVAGIQARADQTIAQINSDAAIQMTQITSQTSLDLARMQADVSLAQTYAAQNINQMNQDGVTERLALQLSALDRARQDARQAEQERMRSQYLLDQQRIQLAQQQAAANLQLAKEASRFQMVQAGLVSGTSNTFGGGNLLTYSRPGVQLTSSTTDPGSDSATTTRSDSEPIFAARQPQIIQARSTRAVVTGRKAPSASFSAKVAPVSTKASTQLLASVQGQGSNYGGELWSSSPGSLTRRSAVVQGSSPTNLQRTTPVTIPKEPAPLFAAASSFPEDTTAQPHRSRQPASVDAPVTYGGHATGNSDTSSY